MALRILGNQLNLRIHPPEGEIKGGLFILHGMLEHLGRYDPLIQRLNGEGFLVAGFNYYGHGENTPLGVMTPAMIPELRSGVLESLRILREEHGIRTLHLFGHSLGSYLARLILDEVKVEGVILSGAGLVDLKKTRGSSNLLGLLGPFMAADKPRQWLSDLVFKDFNRPFGAKSGALFISSKPEEVSRYLEDPLCGRPISLGFARLLIALMGQVDDIEARSVRVDVPITFISGQRDPVGGFGAGVAAVADYYKEINEAPTVLKMVPGRHETLRDVAAEAVVEEILGILKG